MSSYIIIGINSDGYKDVLGFYVVESESVNITRIIIKIKQQKFLIFLSGMSNILQTYFKYNI